MDHVAVLDTLYEISLQKPEQQAAYLEAYISSMLLEDQVHTLLYLRYTHEWLLNTIRSGRYESKTKEETADEVDNSMQNMEKLMHGYVPTRLLTAQAQLAKDLQLERELGLSLNGASQTAFPTPALPPTEPKRGLSADDFVTRVQLKDILGLELRRIDQLRKMPWFPNQVKSGPGIGTKVRFFRVEIDKMLTENNFGEWRRDDDAKDFDKRGSEVKLAQPKDKGRPAKRKM